MISFGEALNIVLNQPVSPATENVAISASTGRILAENIYSDMDMPPFDKSAVDGYACKMENIETRPSLRVVETIPAGVVPLKTVVPGTCSKIMTGAMVPPGADCVVMVEDTLPMEDDQVEFLKDATAKNICFQGEDIKKGDLVLDKGLKIKPADVAVLATVGAVNPLVYKLPRIGIISTGDELVEPSSTPGKAQIRNSNAIQLEAQVRQVPAEPTYYGISPDDGLSLRLIIETALASNDLVLLTGGVSMGDFDFVPAVMQEAGIDILFKSIAIQPGKPTVFGRRNLNYIFGLPGNPVSSYMLFEILVKPFILKLTGHHFQPREVMLPMGKDYSRRKSERKSMIPVQIKDGIVFPVDYHGSAHINAYSKADAVLVIEIGTTYIKHGDPVNVRLL